MDDNSNTDKEENGVKHGLKLENNKQDVEIEQFKNESINEDDEKLSVKSESQISGQEFKQENDNVKIEPSTSELKTEIEEESLDALFLHKEPLFAEICSFFNYFACYLSMKPITFPNLEKMFINTEKNEEIDKELLELHLTLMRKIGYKSVRSDRWENFLQKFLVFIKADEESCILERDGYANLPVITKLEILFQLCVRQFDHNLKFKESIFNTLSYNELRLAAVGKDKNCLNYYYQRDSDLNIRVYTQEPEDESGGTWSLVVRSHDDLKKLIEDLKSVDFGLAKDDNDEELDESNALEVEETTKKTPKKFQNGFANQIEDDPDFWKLLKPEVAQKYYDYLAKRNNFNDCFRDGADINKKKNEKLAKKEAKEAKAAAIVSQQKGEEEKSEEKRDDDENEEEQKQSVEEEIPSELLDEEEEGTGRRVLPRRSARNSAMVNLQKFTATPSKKKVEEKKKEETEEESEDDDDDLEDEEESEQSLGSSDEEFNISNGKKKSGRVRKPRQPKAEGDDDVKKRKKKKKKQVIAFEGDTSEEEEETQVKERKKATPHSLCLKCNKANHPDVLLLCDMCDNPWHTFCLKPSLWYVPDDDWFCPKCHHSMLVDRLTKLETDLCEALKVKQAEDAKKKVAAERLKREMEYIGFSLNNILPQQTKYYDYEESESTEDEDDGQRKSKKKALKKVMGRSRKQEKYWGPVVTIAEGRTRRQTKRVDYNFSAYDEQLQEAMDVIDEPTVKTKYEDHRPTGGAGKGKDMSNIYEAERRRLSDDFDENDEPVKKKRKQKSKRLTDLDVDDGMESEDEEYHASEQEEEEVEPSEDEYVPSDLEVGRRRSGRSRRRSDEDFIDDNSDSDYNPSGRKRGRGVFKRSSGRKRRRIDSEESEEDFISESSDDGYKKKKHKEKSTKRRRIDSFGNYEESEEENGDSEDDKSVKISARGRPMRKAAAKAVLKDVEDDDDEEGNEPVEEEKKDKRPVGALTRKINQDDEFEPDEEEEEEVDEDEIEAENELEKEAVNENEEESEDEDEKESLEEDEDDEEIAPTMVNKRRAPTPPKRSPPRKQEVKKSPPKPELNTKEKSESVEKTPQTSQESSKLPVKTQSSIESAPKSTPTPPMVKPIPISISQPSSSNYQPQFTQPPSVSSVYSPYSQQNQPRFPSHPQAFPPGYYPPANTYGHPMPPPLMPTYVMQPPPGNLYGHHPQFQPNSMNPIQGVPHIQHSPFGLQPIQIQQPSDSDGLAQAITGAMNTDL